MPCNTPTAVMSSQFKNALRKTPVTDGRVSIPNSLCGTLQGMAFQLHPDIAARGQAGRDQPKNQHDDHDLFMWIMENIDRPFAELEARMDKALQCTTFTAQMAAMEDNLNIDPTKLPPALYSKWDRLLTRIAETTFFGQCAPLDQ